MLGKKKKKDVIVFFSEAFGNPAHSELFLELLVPFLMQISMKKVLFSLEWWLQKKLIVFMFVCVGVYGSCYHVCYVADRNVKHIISEKMEILWQRQRRYDW